MNNLNYPADFWRNLAITLAILLFCQYVYYAIQEMMYEESVHQMYRKTEQLDKIRVDILLLEDKVSELSSNDQKLVALIDANRKAIWRDLDVIEQRLPPVKPIKKVK
jgi:hypothetical protein